jgi:1,2-diacylglycerol 3-alpha-glucosyltransferase
MDLLFLSETPYPDHGGGAGKCTHLLATSLAGRGHTVRLLCQGGGSGPPQRIDGIEVHRVPPPPREAVARQDREEATASGLLAYLEQNVPLASVDLVHDSCGFMSFFFPLANRLRQLYAVPVVTHFRYLLWQHFLASFRQFAPRTGGLLLFWEEGIHETTQCFPVRTSDRIICPSQSEAEFVRELYRPSPGLLTVLPDPVRLFDPEPAAVAQLRGELARPGERLVLFGGRIGSSQKGGDVALSALRRLVAARPATRVVLAAGDEPAVARFRHALGAAVTSMGWVRDAAEMARLFAAVDAVAVPSTYESFGLMAAEAMAAGTPVVASPVGAMPELIRHGENGFLLGADPRRWDRELECLLTVLLDDPERCRAMGRQARQTVEATISIERVTDRIEELYREVVASPQSPAQRVRLPRLRPEERESYLAALARRGGEEARLAGEAVLAGWPATVERRCTVCSRHRIAADTRALGALRRARLWRWLPRRQAWRERVEEVVARECPLALLQRERLRTLGRG